MVDVHVLSYIRYSAGLFGEEACPYKAQDEVRDGALGGGKGIVFGENGNIEHSTSNVEEEGEVFGLSAR